MFSSSAVSDEMKRISMSALCVLRKVWQPCRHDFAISVPFVRHFDWRAKRSNQRNLRDLSSLAVTTKANCRADFSQKVADKVRSIL
jgi:hypothetical protein